MSTPMFKSPEPHSTGTILPLNTPFLRPSRISCSVKASPSKNFIISSSSVSATASITISLMGFTLSWYSAGISMSLYPLPEYSLAFMSTTLISPLKDSPAPIGTWKGAMLTPNISLKSSTTLKKSAFSRFILFTNTILGMFFWLVYSQPFSVPTSMPDEASTNSTAPSATLRLENTSPTKSKYPGVSRILILTSFHSTGSTEAPIEICLFISSGSKSEAVVPSSTFPILSTALPLYSMASARVVFPLPPWPISATFLILSV